MSYDVRAIANVILQCAWDEGHSVSNVAINKVVYFLHGIYLVKENRPLVTAKVEAWTYGPVFRELYSSFKKFGSLPITEKVKRFDPSAAALVDARDDLSPSDLSFIRDFAPDYLKMDPFSLVELSHEKGGPWHRVYHHQGLTNPGMEIPDHITREYFEQLSRH